MRGGKLGLLPGPAPVPQRHSEERPPEEEVGGGEDRQQPHPAESLHSLGLTPNTTSKYRNTIKFSLGLVMIFFFTSSLPAGPALVAASGPEKSW